MIYIYYFHQFEEVVKLNIKEELAKGFHRYRISDIFTQELVDKAFNEYTEYSIIIRLFPTDLILLIITIILDIGVSIYIVYSVVKRLISKNSKSKKLNLLQSNEDVSKGLRTHLILSLAIIWSFLSFPMIYWNRYGEWWPIIDDISILQCSLHPIYGFYNLFLIFSLLGIILTSILLFSFSTKGKLILLIKWGLDLGKKEKTSYLINFSIPVLIGIIVLFLEIFEFIPKIDGIMFGILYPLIVIMLVILIPLATNKNIKNHELSRLNSSKNLLKASTYLIFPWAVLFLPLLLTGILDHMYILSLLILSISIIIVSLFEIFYYYRKD